MVPVAPLVTPVAPPVEGRRWLAPEPFSPRSVEGRPVIVTFWSFGCEASIRAVELLGGLAGSWADQVAVLAVHTPRFPYEDDERRLRQAIARHRIRVPVVHDPDYLTWNRYNPTGWPATAVVDRRGRVVGMAGGIEGFETVTEVVATELSRPSGRRDRDRRDADRGRGRAGSGTRHRSTLAASMPDPAEHVLTKPITWIDDIESLRDGTTLWFPSALNIGPSGQLAVADSGNDRLLIGSLDADLRTFRPEVEITDVDDPTALVFGSDSLLYAIERGTDSVLQIDLSAGTVDVVADDELVIPTALIVDDDGSLVVADAGLDQLLRIVGGSSNDILIGPIAGRGVTGCRDGAAEVAELAQPVALARTEAGIAFCDAASSNVRLLTDQGVVRTVTGNEFFDFGLVDGPAHRARLQRPGGLARLADGALAVADTGNDRVRVLRDRRITTLGLAGLDQPAGLVGLASGHLLVADTGNHRLVVADPEGRSGWPLAVYPATMTSVWEDEAGLTA